jgi:hypothetical protein
MMTGSAIRRLLPERLTRPASNRLLTTRLVRSHFRSCPYRRSATSKRPSFLRALFLCKFQRRTGPAEIKELVRRAVQKSRESQRALVTSYCKFMRGASPRTPRTSQAIRQAAAHAQATGMSASAPGSCRYRGCARRVASLPGLAGACSDPALT